MTQKALSINLLVGGAAVCPLCALGFGSRGGAAFLVIHAAAELVVCKTCSIGLPAGYRASYKRYEATVRVQGWLEAASDRSWERLCEYVDAVNHVSDNVLSRSDRLAARSEMLTHHRAVCGSTMWLLMPFELWVYQTFTAVNTPLPANIMEFLNGS